MVFLAESGAAAAKPGSIPKQISLITVGTVVSQHTAEIFTLTCANSSHFKTLL